MKKTNLKNFVDVRESYLLVADEKNKINSKKSLTELGVYLI